MPTQSCSGKSAVFLMESALTSHGSSKSNKKRRTAEESRTTNIHEISESNKRWTVELNFTFGSFDHAIIVWFQYIKCIIFRLQVVHASSIFLNKITFSIVDSTHKTPLIYNFPLASLQNAQINVSTNMTVHKASCLLYTTNNHSLIDLLKNWHRGCESLDII